MLAKRDEPVRFSGWMHQGGTAVTWSVEREPAQGWVVMRFDGALTRQDCARATRRAVEMMNAGAPQAFFVDVSAAHCTLGAGDIYAIPAMWTHATVHRGSALAMLVDPALSDRRDTEFFENTCRNRGWNVRVFADRAAATDWLSGQVSAGDAAVSA